MWLLLLACTGPSAPEPDLQFLRGAVLSDQPLDGARALGERWLLMLDWAPGEAVRIGDQEITAPLRPSCAPLFSVDLGDVSRLIAMSPTAQPATSLAFSPDGAWLAVGSHRGEVVVVDAWTGQERARRALAETFIKEVRWSADSQTLYAGEQSPDANVYALDPATLESRWTLRLADLVGSSTAPDGEDLYGVYSLPGAYGLERLPDGSLLVVALHSWMSDQETRLNRSQVLRVSAEGEILARWPAEPADATLRYPTVDAEGGLMAVIVDRSADGPPPAELPVGGVQLLSLPGLEPRGSASAEALGPHFSRAVIWDGLALDVAQDRLYMGFADGRVQLRRAWDQELVVQLEPSAPMMAGDVPIHATVGGGVFQEGALAFVTNGTHIPWGAAAPDLQPPSAHPSENTLWVVDLEGQPLWSWTGEQRVEGLSLSQDGQHALVGAGIRTGDARRDLYGGLVFDLGGPARSGEARLEVFCRTEGPVYTRHALSADGRVALAEQPVMSKDGKLLGGYRVTVLR